MSGCGSLCSSASMLDTLRMSMTRGLVMERHVKTAVISKLQRCRLASAGLSGSSSISTRCCACLCVYACTAPLVRLLYWFQEAVHFKMPNHRPSDDNAPACACMGPISTSPYKTYSVQLGKLNCCPGGKVLQCHQLFVAMHSQYNC